jgi:acyl carrier protein
MGAGIDVRSAIKETLARELKLPPSQLDGKRTLHDIGLDSLAFAEVVIAIETKMGHKANMEMIAAKLTIDTSIDEAIDTLASALE